MSWCDKLASTPGVGYFLTPHFASSDSVLTSMSSLLDPLYKDNKQLFNVTQQTSFEIQWATNDGYHYAIEPSKLGVTFRHRMRPRNVSGGPPMMDLLSRPAPYTELLKDVSKRLVEAASLVPAAKSRTVSRLGIVSTTAIDEADLPPGIQRFIEYVGRPWQGDAETFNISITAKVGEGQGYSDRCIHTVTKPEDKEQLMTVNFDWQRLYTSDRANKASELNDEMEKGQKAALRYFEDLAEGRRFDEKLISEAAAV